MTACCLLQTFKIQFSAEAVAAVLQVDKLSRWVFEYYL